MRDQPCWQTKEASQLCIKFNRHISGRWKIGPKILFPVMLASPKFHEVPGQKEMESGQLVSRILSLYVWLFLSLCLLSSWTRSVHVWSVYGLWGQGLFPLWHIHCLSVNNIKLVIRLTSLWTVFEHKHSRYGSSLANQAWCQIFSSCLNLSLGY